MYTALQHCRICGNARLELVLDLGIQALTGVFPRDPGEELTTGPIQLVKCMGDDVCGLLQLGHSYELGEMYGDNYGYRSGLNASMVRHLNDKVARIRKLVSLQAGDLVVDIGSNDSTTLQAYPPSLTLVGVDPTGTKFKEYYPPHVKLIPDFFSAALVAQRFPGLKAKVVTSFSMFYDLPDPLAFVRDIHAILAEDGVWVFEQSYMPAMLDTNSYDTACHEHLEYYALHQIRWLTDKAGFDIVDVEFNAVNGGSFSVTVKKAGGDGVGEVPAAVRQILDEEQRRGLHTLAPYREFAARVSRLRDELKELLDSLRRDGKTIAGLGASTKGNVLLQYCGLTSSTIARIAEVNSEKYGRYTPGSHIPIEPENQVLSQSPDYLLVLPWHFRAFFEASPHFAGRKLIFPLPRVEVTTNTPR